MKNAQFILTADYRKIAFNVRSNCTRRMSFSRAIWLFVMSIFLASPLQMAKIYGQANNQAVLDAYELRVNGECDQARALLEEVLESDSNSAMANLEMARLVEETDPMAIDAIFSYCDKAIQSAPSDAPLAFYRARVAFLGAFISMRKGDNEVVAEQIGYTREAFEQVLKLDPRCVEARLYLVDIYSALPSDMGGDSAKAFELIEELYQIDRLAAARARLTAIGADADPVEYWKSYINREGESEEALVMVGKAFLMKDDILNADICFEKVITSNPTRANLYLDLARGCAYRVMKQQDSTGHDLEQASKYLHLYLEADTDKPVCTEAWCYGMLSRVEIFMENKEESDRCIQKAMELCPTFSKAMAVPTPDDPPDEMHYHYRSFFTAF